MWGSIVQTINQLNHEIIPESTLMKHLLTIPREHCIRIDIWAIFHSKWIVAEIHRKISTRKTFMSSMHMRKCVQGNRNSRIQERILSKDIEKLEGCYEISVQGISSAEDLTTKCRAPTLFIVAYFNFRFLALRTRDTKRSWSRDPSRFSKTKQKYRYSPRVSVATKHQVISLEAFWNTLTFRNWSIRQASKCLAIDCQGMAW